MTVRITLVGSVSITSGGEVPVVLSSSQVQLAVARLVLERRTGTARDALADTLWPDRLPSTWASALRSLVSRVRQFLQSASTTPDTSIVAHGGRYRVDMTDDLEVDIEVAERSLQHAIACLAEGDFEGAQRGADAAADAVRAPFFPAHDGEWVAMVRARVEELHLGALECASAAAVALGRYEHGLSTIDEAIRRAPHRESAHRCRMAAHAGAGNRAEALDAYFGLRRYMVDEIGVDPSEETEDAYLALLGSPSTADGAHGTVLRRGVLARSGFVGRQDECSELLDTWRQVRTTGFHLTIVDGPSGIGKTRLVTEVAGRIRRAGGQVLFGRCDRNSIVAFQPIIEALQGYVSSTPEDLQAPVADRVRALVDSAIEELATGRDHVASDSAGRLLALGEFIGELAQSRATMLILDDVDVARGATIEALRHVATRTHEQPLWVVCTSRVPVEVLTRRLDALHGLQLDRRRSSLTLDGLNARSVVAIATSLTGDDGHEFDAGRLHVDTGGNPYLAIEIALAARADLRIDVDPLIPPSIHEYVASRLGDVPVMLRNVVRVAAVAGNSFELDVVARAAQVDTQNVDDLCGLVASTGLVRLEDSGAERAAVTSPLDGLHGTDRTSALGMRFVQGIVPLAIVAQLSGDRLRAIHSDLAGAIQTLRADRLDDYARSIGHHRSAAGSGLNGDGTAVRWNRRAAERALELSQPDDAVRLLRVALNDVPDDDGDLRAETLTALGFAELAAGAHGAERSLIDGAIRAASVGRVDVLSRAALGLCEAARVRPELRDEAVALATDVLRSSAGDIAAGVRIATSHPPHADSGGGGDPGLTLARLAARCLALGGRLDEHGVVRSAGHVLHGALDQLGGPADSDARRMMAAELLTLGDRLDDAVFCFVGAYHSSMAAAYDGDESGVDASTSRLVTADGAGDLLLAERSVVIASARGMFVDAVALAQLACPLRPFDPMSNQGEGSGAMQPTTSASTQVRLDPAPGSYCRRQLDVVDWMLGRVPENAHRPAGWDTREWLTTGNVTVDGAMLALRLGDHGRARIAARALANGLSDLPVGDEWSHAIALLALVAVELADEPAAQALHDTIAVHRSKTFGCGFRSYVGPASFHLGRLAAVLGAWDDAERELISARVTVAGRAARPWVALCDRSLADVYERRGRPDDRAHVEPLRISATAMLRSLGVST